MVLLESVWLYYHRSSSDLKTLILLLLGAFLCVGGFGFFVVLSSIPTNFVPEEQVPRFYRLFFNFKYNPTQNALIKPTPTLLTNIIIGTCLIAGISLIYKSVGQLEKKFPPESKPKPLPLQFLKPYLPSIAILLSIILLTGIVHTIFYGSWIINLVVGTVYFLGVFGLHSMYKSLTGRDTRSRWLMLFISAMSLLIAYFTLEALL